MLRTESNTSGFVTRFVHELLSYMETCQSEQSSFSGESYWLKAISEKFILELAFMPDDILAHWLQGRPRLTKAVALCKSAMYKKQADDIPDEP